MKQGDTVSVKVDGEQIEWRKKENGKWELMFTPEVVLNYLSFGQSSSVYEFRIVPKPSERFVK
jgi:hypothetical protein